MPALCKMPGVCFRAKGDCYMQPISKCLPQPKLGRCLLVLGALSLAGPAAQAQNIDEGKSAQRLFADTCVNCHRSAKGLAKGRFRPTLFLFLQDHYTTSTSAAWGLASYLASVDTPQSRSRAASHSATKKPRSPTRPPAPPAQ
jgi:mono/diheme cytochrome c family protein